MQQKDVIYIDVEDDITAIIGKVKAAKEKIVALVPPKRIGVLQSAVNLRLLARAADGADKRLVLITGNAALSGLAATAKIPVAKNLQSKPELAEIPALKVDDDDVIDGEQLSPASENTTAGTVASAVPPSTISGISIDGDTPSSHSTDKKPKPKKGVKIPDFGSFRKRMAFGAIGGTLLIVFLVWAIWYAPRATIVISARTSDQVVNMPITLGSDLTTDTEKATIKSIVQQEKVSQSVDFDATGQKDAGEKAKGTVKFSTSSLFGLGTIPANTVLQTSSGLSFLTDSAVTLTYTGGTTSTATTTVTAAETGTKYNGATGALSGTSSAVSATLVDATSGGTTRMIAVVQQADVEKAKQQIADQDTTEVKKKLQSRFDSGAVIIKDSFTTNAGEAVSAPTIGNEATNGKAKLTRDITYIMTGIAKSELDDYLKVSLQKTLANESGQRVYDTGQSTAKFEDFKAGENNVSTVVLTATGQVGPKINDDTIKEQVKGRRYGEIVADLKVIDGVSDVDVNLSPFWVQTVPNDTKKITIEFKLIKNNG